MGSGVSKRNDNEDEFGNLKYDEFGNKNEFEYNNKNAMLSPSDYAADRDDYRDYTPTKPKPNQNQNPEQTLEDYEDNIQQPYKEGMKFREYPGMLITETHYTTKKGTYKSTNIKPTLEQYKLMFSNPEKNEFTRNFPPYYNGDDVNGGRMRKHSRRKRGKISRNKRSRRR